MKTTVLTLLFLSFSLSSFAHSAQPFKPRETLKDKLVGSMVKTFAKTYVATTNLQKFKEKNIKKIMKMDEAKFQRVYGKIYREMIVDLPQALKDTYGVTEKMTKEKAIAQINSFASKKQIYNMINAIPNRMIAQHFKKHKDEFKKTMKGKNADGLIDQMLEDSAASNS